MAQVLLLETAHRRHQKGVRVLKLVRARSTLALAKTFHTLRETAGAELLGSFHKLLPSAGSSSLCTFEQPFSTNDPFSACFYLIYSEYYTNLHTSLKNTNCSSLCAPMEMTIFLLFCTDQSNSPKPAARTNFSYHLQSII